MSLTAPCVHPQTLSSAPSDGFTYSPFEGYPTALYGIKAHGREASSLVSGLKAAAGVTGTFCPRDLYPGKVKLYVSPLAPGAIFYCAPDDIVRVEMEDIKFRILIWHSGTVANLIWKISLLKMPKRHDSHSVRGGEREGGQNKRNSNYMEYTELLLFF